MCVCEREKVFVCVWKRVCERECVCVCVKERAGEGERSGLSACASPGICEGGSVYVYAREGVSA